MVNIREKGRPTSGIYSNYKKSKGKPVLYLALLLVVILIMVIVYKPSGNTDKMYQERKNNESSASAEPLFNKHGELTFYKADSTRVQLIDIEIADDDDKRERGLMYRRQMELNQGMLFIFEEEDLLSFWMKNTYLPLDILYLTGEKKIIRIHENVPTLDERSIPSDFPAKYVVEVNAGFCALNNIEVGDYMMFVRKFNQN